MRMTHFKNANVDVSQLAVGTWGLDSLRWNGAMSETEAIEAIRAMIQGGVNLIDTAPNYGNHSSEQIVGKAIQGLNRSEILISTKFGTHNDLFIGGVFRDARFRYGHGGNASSLQQPPDRLRRFLFPALAGYAHADCGNDVCPELLKAAGKNPLYRLVQLRSAVIGGSDEIRSDRRRSAALLDD